MFPNMQQMPGMSSGQTRSSGLARLGHFLGGLGSMHRAAEAELMLHNARSAISSHYRQADVSHEYSQRYKLANTLHNEGEDRMNRVVNAAAERGVGVKEVRFGSNGDFSVSHESNYIDRLNEGVQAKIAARRQAAEEAAKQKGSRSAEFHGDSGEEDGAEQSAGSGLCGGRTKSGNSCKAPKNLCQHHK